MMTPYSIIKSYIENNKLKEAIQDLLSLSIDEKSKDIVRVLSARLKSVKDRRISGVMSDKEAMDEETKIASQLLDLANDIFSNLTTNEPENSHFPNKDNQLVSTAFDQLNLLKLIHTYAQKEPDQWIASKVLQDYFKIDSKTLSFHLLQLKEKELIQVKFIMDKSLVKITANGILIIS